MNISTPTLLGICITVGLLLAGLARFLEFIIVDMTRRGKKRIVWIDDDSRTLTIGWAKTGGKGPAGVILADNEFTVGKGDAAKLYRLEGNAAYPGKWTTYIIHPRHGWNLRGPLDADTVLKGTYEAVLSLFDPTVNFKSVSMNHARETFGKNRDNKDDWKGKAIVAAVILGGLTLATVAYIAVKMSNSGAA